MIASIDVYGHFDAIYHTVMKFTAENKQRTALESSAAQKCAFTFSKQIRLVHMERKTRRAVYKSGGCWRMGCGELESGYEPEEKPHAPTTRNVATPKSCGFNFSAQSQVNVYIKILLLSKELAKGGNQLRNRIAQKHVR